MKLREALEHSWSEDTTYCYISFDSENPSLGQCLVSSLVVQDYLGGEIYSGKVREPDGYVSNHYWLRIKGIDIDLTWQQFPPYSVLYNVRKSSRGVLRLKHVRERYELLANQVKEHLKIK